MSIRVEEPEQDLDLDTSDDEELIDPVNSDKKIEEIKQEKLEIPDAETKKVLGNIPKLLETMSIQELPHDVKKQYQEHVNKLKSIRAFLVESNTNFTTIHTTYSCLMDNLTSSLFSQVNHEVFSAILFILLDLYYSFFEGNHEFLRPFMRSLKLPPELRKAAKKITKGKKSMSSPDKSSLSMNDLTIFILDHFKQKIENNEEICEFSFVIYEQFVCLVWNSMFYIKLRQANYDSNRFIGNILQIIFKKFLKRQFHSTSLKN